MKIKLLGILLLTATLNAAAWSHKGHDTVAYIAECHFTPATADSVAALLDGRSPVYWANWLDNASYTPTYGYTKTWHYKNIDEDVKYSDAPINPKGDVVTASREQIAILADPKSTKDQKSLALKILVHLLGDMHQPMHLGHLTDRGGNSVKVKFFDNNTNLHSIWDGALMNAAHAWSYTEWQQQLDRLSAAQEQEIVAGNIDDWAAQTHAIATRVYDYFPAGSKASYNQIAAWTGTIENQLLRGGLRLAYVLNAIFDPDSKKNVAEF